MNNRIVPPNSTILSLCTVCARQFYAAHSTSIRRFDPYQIEKEDCSYCGIRTGWDYIIVPKAKNNFHRFRDNTCRLGGEIIGSNTTFVREEFYGRNQGCETRND